MSDLTRYMLEGQGVEAIEILMCMYRSVLDPNFSRKRARHAAAQRLWKYRARGLKLGRTKGRGQHKPLVRSRKELSGLLFMPMDKTLGDNFMRVYGPELEQFLIRLEGQLVHSDDDSEQPTCCPGPCSQVQVQEEQPAHPDDDPRTLPPMVKTQVGSSNDPTSLPAACKSMMEELVEGQPGVYSGVVDTWKVAKQFMATLQDQTGTQFTEEPSKLNGDKFMKVYSCHLGGQPGWVTRACGKSQTDVKREKGDCSSLEVGCKACVFASMSTPYASRCGLLDLDTRQASTPDNSEVTFIIDLNHANHVNLDQRQHEPTRQQHKPTLQQNKPTLQQSEPTLQQHKPTLQQNEPTLQQNEPTLEQHEPIMQWSTVRKRSNPRRRPFHIRSQAKQPCTDTCSQGRGDSYWGVSGSLEEKSWRGDS